ncbi:hypothetical protein BC830DRAFT_1105570 [Chytriomyces sp. MP71]|nr:hypothetical protein BC830DRAFT_1105570 [Chytriomyces sp. MP71]
MPDITISTHILNTATGKPASNVPVALHRLGSKGEWTAAVAAENITTNSDGRIDAPFRVGVDPTDRTTFRMRFETANVSDFYPYVEIVFVVDLKADPRTHFHIPLLLSPFGYSTYRGS